jgi:uncharacterized protein YqeY
MGILNNLSEEIKNAMRAKNTIKLESLRAIKSALLLIQTSSSGSGDISDEESIKLLQRLVKQRKESAIIFRDQNRPDLAEPEEAQAEVISTFLPAQISESEITKVIEDIITQTGASGMKEMGQVMGIAAKALMGKADGKTISTIIKNKLSS